jgi:hypothetical protein
MQTLIQDKVLLEMGCGIGRIIKLFSLYCIHDEVEKY